MHAPPASTPGAVPPSRVHFVLYGIVGRRTKAPTELALLDKILHFLAFFTQRVRTIVSDLGANMYDGAVSRDSTNLK